MAKAKNGFHDELDLPEKAALRGRPPRKEVDPVRRGVWALMRSLREAQNMWNQFVQYNEDEEKFVTVDERGVEHVRRAVEFMSSRIETIVKDIEMRQLELLSYKKKLSANMTYGKWSKAVGNKNGSAKKKPAPRKAKKARAARSASKAVKATEVAQA